MKLYAKNSAGTVTLLASSGGASGTVSSVSGTGTVNGLTLTGTVTTSGSLTLGGTLSLVSPPPIGSTTPNTGAFTTLSATGAVVLTAGGATLNLNGTTSNYIVWATEGVATPTFTSRSAGTKLVLYPSLSPSAADYGFGIASGVLWSSIPTTSADFRWYGGTTVAATLSGTGSLSLAGTITSTSTASFSGGNFTIDANGSFTTQGSTIGTNVPNGTVGINTGPAGGVALTLTNKAGNTAFNTVRIVGIAGQANIIDIVDSGGFSVFRVLGNGAIGVNNNSYGTAGQVLTSGGSGSAATWAAAGGGSQAFVAFGSTGGL
jgi:hypothetical protein